MGVDIDVHQGGAEWHLFDDARALQAAQRGLPLHDVLGGGGRPCTSLCRQICIHLQQKFLLIPSLPPWEMYPTNEGFP